MHLLFFFCGCVGLSFYSLDLLGHQTISVIRRAPAHLSIRNSFTRLRISDSQTINLTENLPLLLGPLPGLYFRRSLYDLHLAQTALFFISLATKFLFQTLLLFLCSAARLFQQSQLCLRLLVEFNFEP
jgi:hypothetical protein